VFKGLLAVTQQLLVNGLVID